MKTIGIVMRLEDFDGTRKWFVNQPYIEAITHLGWAIMPLCSKESALDAVEHCDALLIPGGYDLHSYYLHEPVHESCTFYDSLQDHFDFYCIDLFVRHEKPILGICRGMQLLNVYLGGNLLQHIDAQAHAPSHIHNIQLTSRSFLHQLYPNTVSVNSYHHQVVGHLGKGLIASAHSDEAYVEAIEHVNHKIFGVQWHPELQKDDQLFPYFLDVVCA